MTMNFILNVFTFVVACGLMALTVKGAYSLTHSVAVTLVFSALVVLQWAAARRALDAINETQVGGKRSRRWQALPWGVLWLAVASISVSFVGGELYQIFSARSAATERFEVERTQLHSRARELTNLYRSVDGQLLEYSKYARDMATQEAAHGGSCKVSMGSGPGDIRAFRQADARAAAALSAQLAPDLKDVQASLDNIKGIQFEGPVPDVLRRLADASNQANALSQTHILAQVSGLVAAAEEAARSIRVKGQIFNCEDAARGLFLQQLGATATAIGELKPLSAPLLLDPTDARAIAQGTLIRTWATMLGWLPQSIRGSKPLVDASFQVRFALKDTALLSEANLPLLLAWVLEFVLVALMFATRGSDGPGLGQRAARKMLHWALENLSARHGPIGRLATVLGGPLPAAGWRAPYVDRARLFADDAMEERAHAVAPWYRPYGDLDVIVVPLTSFVAVRAARELLRAGLLGRLASEIDTRQLMRDKRFARVMCALGGQLPDTAWEVYRVQDPHLVRWLLAQPIEARAALSAV